MTTLPVHDRGSSVLTVGFGVTVAMWAVGYVSRLPMLLLPSPLLLLLLVGCLFAGGWALGRYTGLGWRHGAAAGGITGLLNLLVLGSLVTDQGATAPSALLWLPGSILLAALLAAGGAVVGERWFRRQSPYLHWSAALVRVGIAAALLLLAVGGLVTSADAGLAVVDWPNSFGYNMFLYPLSRMTGGIYYEHSHRLFGALVGLTTLVMALNLQLREPRRWVRGLAWTAVLLVIVQGLLGGLRVTGSFTLSSSVEVMRPSVLLALVHGVLAQLFFALLVALGAFTSPTWLGAAPVLRRGSVSTDRTISLLLLALLIGQLVLGAVQRHLSALLLTHILVGVALVAPLAIHVGFRAWGLNEGQRLLQRLGLGLVVTVAVQILLGLVAYVATRGEGLPPTARLLTTTAHQWVGAVLLALVVSLVCWNFRLLEGGAESQSGAA